MDFDEEQEHDETTKKIDDEHRFHFPFLCLVASIFILISLLNIHLFKEKESVRSNNIEGFSLGLIRLQDSHIRETGTLLSLIIIIFNCFSLMIFTLEIYLNDQLIERVATSSG